LSPIHVAIIGADDSDRAGLEILVAHQPGLAAAGSFSSTDQAVTRACEGAGTPWDLVLLDLQPAGTHDLQAIRHLKSLIPEAQIIVLIGAEEPSTILQAIRAGANGYIVKPAVVAEVLETVHTVISGGSPMTPGVARAVLSLAPEPATGAARPEGGAQLTPRFELSDRDREVLEHLAAGLSTAQVAATLEIGINGVRTHLRHIYRRLQVHSVAEAVLRALRGGTT